MVLGRWINNKLTHKRTKWMFLNQTLFCLTNFYNISGSQAEMIWITSSSNSPTLLATVNQATAEFLTFDKIKRNQGIRRTIMMNDDKKSNTKVLKYCKNFTLKWWDEVHMKPRIGYCDGFSIYSAQLTFSLSIFVLVKKRGKLLKCQNPHCYLDWCQFLVRYVVPKIFDML